MKKILSLILAVMLVFSSVPAVFAAFADEAKWPTSVSWAKDAIHYMAEEGVVNGFWEDNTFRPADSVTRVQFIKMIVEMFGLTKTTSINYSDVKSTDWFYPYVQKAAAQGFILNAGLYAGASSLDPNGPLTREEAAALLASYLDLDPNKKAASSTYKDFNTIKSKYQNYVLQATYEGLFEGDDTGNFSPQRVLRRCEAVAILYRAAGSIYKESATGIDAGASPKNAVIAKSGVIVSSANIKGKLHITEGTAGGIVMLNKCDLETVIVRGNASVTFTDCDIDELIIDSASAPTITLTEGSKATKITANTAAKITVNDTSEIGELTVESAAKNSSVTGTGALKSATIKATGFKADMMPGKYTISSGISATFAGNVYSGSADASANGFTATPTMYSTTAGLFLTVKPSATGTLYYYYTNTAAAPTKTTYMNFYNNAAVKNNFAVSSGSTKDAEIGKTASVASYSYVVLMLTTSTGTSYQPIVLQNKVASGFVSTPVLSTYGTYDRLTLTPSVSGQVQYYYTETPTIPTTATYASLYASAKYKSTLTVTANASLAQNTTLTSNVAAYPYVVLMMKDASGNLYQPIVISKDGIVGTDSNGFSTVPFIRSDNGTIKVGMNAVATGTVEYYYTNTSTVPTTAQFDANYASAAATYKGTFSVTENVSIYNSLANQNIAKVNTYVVFRLTAGGTKYQAVVVKMPALDQTALTAAGFTAMPSCSASNGYFYLTLPASKYGTVYYYLTDNATAPSRDAFVANYAGATGSGISEKTGGTLTVNIGSQTLQTNLRNTTSRKYMALMCEYAGVKMTPIIIPLVGAADPFAPITPTTSGFTKTPTCVADETVERYRYITVNPSVSGTVYYYFSYDPTSPSAADFIEIVNAEMTAGSGSGTPAGRATVWANQETNIPVMVGYSFNMPYLHIMLVDASGVAYVPVMIPSNGGTATDTAHEAGFVTQPTAKSVGTTMTLTYNPITSGKLYYYLSNSASVPANETVFINTYYGGSVDDVRGEFNISAGSKTKTILAPLGYTYVVLMVQNSSEYCKPITIAINGASSGVSGFTGTPYVSDYTLYFTPSMTGTLVFYFTDMDNMADFTESITKTPALAAAGGTKTISYKSTQVMNLLGAVPSLSAQTVKEFKNVVVWMTSGSVKSDPIFVSLSAVTGGSTTQNPEAGFTEAPALEGSYIFFTPSATGNLKYFYTNSTATYDATSFKNTHPLQVQNGVGNIVPVTKGSSNFLDVTPGMASYKYVWVLLDTGTSNYTPVRIQIK